MKRLLEKLGKKQEEEPVTWNDEAEPAVKVEPVEEATPLDTVEWGKDQEVVFKHNTRIKAIRILAVVYIFLNILVGILFTSNSMLINIVVFLYLAPNTLILLHYLKLIQEKM